MAHMDTTRVTQEQVDAAQALVTAAASQGYDAFRAAQAARDALIARRDEESGAASEMVYVVGETFRAKDRLRRMGLRWDAGHHAWVGTRRYGMASRRVAGLSTAPRRAWRPWTTRTAHIDGRLQAVQG